METSHTRIVSLAWLAEFPLVSMPGRSPTGFTYYTTDELIGHWEAWRVLHTRKHLATLREGKRDSLAHTQQDNPAGSTSADTPLDGGVVGRGSGQPDQGV